MLLDAAINEADQDRRLTLSRATLGSTTIQFIFS